MLRLSISDFQGYERFTQKCISVVLNVPGCEGMCAIHVILNNLKSYIA